MPDSINNKQQQGTKNTNAVVDGFHPIICMDYQMVANRRSVRNQSQRLQKQHDTIKKKLGQLIERQTKDNFRYTAGQIEVGEK